MMAAGFMLTGLAGIAAALDLGMLYYSKRDLQRIANLAALDAAQVAGGCLGVLDNIALAAQTEAEGSAQRNGGSQIAGLSLTAAVGSQGSDGTLRQFDAVDDPQNRAVRVTVTRPDNTRIFPFFNSSGGTLLTASAAALSTPKARVSVGSKLLQIDDGDESDLDAIFEPLLGGAPTLDVATYRALFGAGVPVQELLERLPGSPEGPPTDPVNVAELLQTISDLLDEQGDPIAAAGAQAMANAADTSRDVDLSLVLGDEEPAADALVNAGNLIRALGQASLADTVFSLGLMLPPPLGNSTIAGLPGTAATASTLVAGGIITDPDNYARNSQILQSVDIPLTLPGITGLGQLSFFVEGAEATAEVDSISCGHRGQPLDSANISARSSITRIGIGRFADITSPDPEPEPVTVVDADSTLTVTNGLGLPVIVPIHVRISASAYVNVGSNEYEQFPAMIEGEVRRLGTPSSVALAQALADIPGALTVTPDITLLGSVSPLLQPLVNAAIATLGTTLTTAVEAAIEEDLLPAIDSQLGPELDALGVTLGGADIRMDSISAQQPELFLR